MIGFVTPDRNAKVPPVVVLIQDGEDVNLKVDGHTVAYLNGNTGKLTMMGRSERAREELKEKGVVITTAGYVATDFC